MNRFATTVARFLPLCLILTISQPALANSPFVHPGILHDHDDLDRMKRSVAAKQEPLFSGFEKLRTDPASQSNYVMLGPLEMVGRNPTVGHANYDSDANAAYQCAIMWCITGEKNYAEKSKQIINAWSSTLKSITGRDAVLMAGLGPFKMINAAEIIRYTDAGWAPEDARRAEKHFREVVYPVIKDFAPFANGNWDAAAIKTMMAIAVFCNDRQMFERAIDYYVNGTGNGSLTHYIINESGQCQESGRDQQHTQLGLAHLGDACEIAWHQGLDLYGIDDNLLLKGFEYTARYNLGDDVPFAKIVDRTGKYPHSHISAEGRGRFRPVFEQIYNHYTGRAGVPAPWTKRAAEHIRPEGAGSSGADHAGFGTLLFSRPSISHDRTLFRHAPMPPAGMIASASENKIMLTWVGSVGTTAYTVKRATGSQDFQVITKSVSSVSYTDEAVEPGAIYRYAISASNAAGRSDDSNPISVCAELPPGWSHRDIGSVPIPGHAAFDGNEFTIEVAGKDIGGTNDQCQFAFARLDRDGTVVARFVPQTSSQFSKFGLMMRGSLGGDAVHVSLLIEPEAHGRVEEPAWTVRLISRDSAGSSATIRNTSEGLSEPAVTFGRLTGVCWLKLQRAGNAFTGFYSLDGQSWKQAGTAAISLPKNVLAGLTVCSGLSGVTTRVRFDNVGVSQRSADR